MNILIISHTDHYIDANGAIVGWGPTVREIDELANRFGPVTHIACLHNGTAPASALAYQSKNVKFIPIPPFGGNRLKNKLSILTAAPANLYKVAKALKGADIFQFRAPTSIGLYLIPYLSWLTRKKGWYKYAGNWMVNQTALSYRLQKWMLVNLQSKSVTINGAWQHQPAHCFSFENPCLDADDRMDGLACVKNKDFSMPLRICVVGRLDEEKGIHTALKAIENYPHLHRIAEVDIVGDGPYRSELEIISTNIKVPITFHGALPREKVFEIYNQSHLLLLPSQSEGFPKVVAEAANFGCVPVVSDISAIGQYLNDENGFLWKPLQESFSNFFSSIDLSPVSLKEKSLQAHNMAGAFTYDNYMDKLERLIFN